MRISDGSSDVCSSDLAAVLGHTLPIEHAPERGRRLRRAARADERSGEDPPRGRRAARRLPVRWRRFQQRGQHDGAAFDEPREYLLDRSEEHTSELQSLMRISYAVFCLKTQNIRKQT